MHRALCQILSAVSRETWGENLLPVIYPVSRPGRGTVSTSGHPAGGQLLESKIAGLRRLGVDVVVSAQTDDERIECGLIEEASVVAAAGMRFVCLPIEDRAVPVLGEVEDVVGELYAGYRQGLHVLFHCWAGIGRSSLLAAMLLGMDGVSPGEALGLISAARGRVVPDTDEQTRWLEEWWAGWAEGRFHVKP